MQKKIYVWFTALLMTAAMFPQTKPAQKKSAQNFNAQWIAKLKATPLADMESGLPDKTFGKWFAEQSGSGQPQYAVHPCEGDDQPNGPMCVVASAKVSRVRKLELTFALMGGERTVQNDKNPEQKQATCRFLIGSVGPSDSQMKFPTRVIRKLSDLPPLVRGRSPSAPNRP
jgi:hypothetical protein